MSHGNSAPPSARQAIIIAGMHRSGTSALGGVLRALGAAAPKTLIPPDAFNRHGYWESLPLMTLNEELIRSAGSSWHDWRAIEPKWLGSTAAEEYRARIEAVLSSEYGEEPLFFIKDPRICRFMPFLISVLTDMGIRPACLIPIRNPLEVACSLERRNGMTISKAYLLWLRHVLEAEYRSRAVPRYIARYESLLSDWQFHLERAAENLGVRWPALSGRQYAKIDASLNMDLYHERRTIDELRNHSESHSLVIDVYDALTALADDADNRAAMHQLDSLRSTFEEGCALFGPAAAVDELTLIRMRDEAVARTSELERLRQENVRLADCLVRQSEATHRITAERDQLAAECNELAAERNSLVRDRDALSGTNRRLATERDALSGTNRRLATERDALSDTNRRLATERDALSRDRDKAVAERDQMLASRSWRLTRPLRKIRSFFVSRRGQNRR